MKRQSIMISVIIPVYNPGVRLKKMLDCILVQSEANFEVIIVDDGSTDGSEAICEEYILRDSRFRVIHQPNRGVSAARNRGMAEAKGDYITFLDADDEIPEDYLGVLLETQIKTDAEIVCCDVAIIQDGNEIGRFTHEFSVLEQRQALNLLLSRRMINSGPCAKLFCQKVLYLVEFPSLCVYEDILFVRDVFTRAGKIAITDKTEYRYIQNNKSTMHKKSFAPSLDIVKATDDLTNYICNHNEIDTYCLYITISHMMQYVIPIAGSKTIEDRSFIKSVRNLLNKYRRQIIFCDAFPWKEKVLFVLFGINKAVYFLVTNFALHISKKK